MAARGTGWLPLIGVNALVGTAVTLALPSALGHAVDAFIAKEPPHRWLMLVGVLVLSGVVVDLVDAYAGTACVTGATAWLRNRLVRHLLAAGPESSRRFETGDLVSRISGNAAEAAKAGLSVVMVLTAVLPPVGSLVLLAVIDSWLAAAFLGGVALVTVVLWAFTRRTAEVMAGYQQTQGRLAAALAESLAGARTIAAAGTIGREERRVLQPLRELHYHGMRTWQALARSSAEAAVVGPLVLVAVLGAGGFALLADRITPGELFAASRYAVLGAGLGSLTGVLGQFARARAGVRRTNEVLAVPRVRYGERPAPSGPGRLEFRGVTVHGHERPLLDGVNLVLPGGAAVAVVGRSGAGKSTLAALAVRLREPDAGQILLDGVPLGELSHEALRAAVGCAFERPVLVGRTVGDAVGLGQRREAVVAAARATRAHEFVSRLPRGYDTPLTDAPMSGGELQRLGLARAWHAGRVLVLDDATSSLDMVTEMQIGRALTDDHGRRTRLIVTHRAATAARANLVVWLDAGRVRAIGPHSLLWTYPEYRKVFG